MRDLVPFVKFKKRKKRPWRKVTFSYLHAEASHSITYCLLPNQILRESLHKFNCECQDQDMGNYNYLQLPA